MPTLTKTKSTQTDLNLLPKVSQIPQIITRHVKTGENDTRGRSVSQKLFTRYQSLSYRFPYIKFIVTFKIRENGLEMRRGRRWQAE